MTEVKSASNVWVVYGAQGWIGKQFHQEVERFNQENMRCGNPNRQIQFVASKCRLDDLDACRKELKGLSPKATHLISFVGRTSGGTFNNIDYLEQKGKLVENMRDNLHAPMNLGCLAQELDCHATYLGTGCIFHYDSIHKVPKQGKGSHVDDPEIIGFKEEDVPNFFGSAYSTVKGTTDILMKQLDKKVLNVRIRMPITYQHHKKNFIYKIAQFAKVIDIPNSMTVLPELLPILILLILRKKTGTINLTNPGTISHTQVLEYYKTYVNPKHEWKTFTVEEQKKVLIADRSNNYLDTKKLETWVQELRADGEKIEFHDIQEATRLTSAKMGNLSMLVTGGFGFIGSNFINEQNRKGKRCVILDRFTYVSRVEHIEQLSMNHWVKGNINDSQLVSELLEDFQITHVIHFAAQSHVDRSFEDAGIFIEDNVKGTHTLLEACKESKGPKLKLFLHMSTDEVYGSNTSPLPFTEESPMKPTNPYAASKAGSELMVRAYHISYGLPAIIIRGNNVTNFYQYPDKLISRFTCLLLKGQKCQVHGKGTTFRSFLHALDLCDAIALLLEKGTIGEIYNIGEKKEWSVMQITSALINYIIPGAAIEDWVEYVKDRPFNDLSYLIDTSKITALGFQPKRKLMDELPNIIEWYKKNAQLYE